MITQNLSAGKNFSDKGRSRVMEIDFIKGFCLLAMVTEHCLGEFYMGEPGAGLSILENIFDVLIGASAFMFCMGFTLDIGRIHTPQHCLKRGLTLLCTSFFLNFFRSTIPYLTFFGTMESDYVFMWMIDILINDILAFAGMAFLLLALLKKLKLNAWGIFAVAVALSVIGYFCRFTDTGMPVANALLGYLVGTKAEAEFPLFYWFIFVAAGNLFREYYLKIKNKKKFYLIMLPVAAALTTAFLVLGSKGVKPFECIIGETYKYAWMNTFDAFGSLCCCFTYLGVMWLLSQLVEKLHITKFRPLSYLAENLPGLYLVQWVLIANVYFFLMRWLKVLPAPQTPIALTAYVVCILALTVLIHELYKKYCRAGVLKFLEKNQILCAVVILAVTVAVVLLSVSHGLPEIPSYHNDYAINGVSVYY